MGRLPIMRTAKVVIGAFILLIGVYFYVNVKDMTPAPYSFDTDVKSLSVQKVS